jgi:hypothetical protein
MSSELKRATICFGRSILQIRESTFSNAAASYFQSTSTKVMRRASPLLPNS